MKKSRHLSLLRSIRNQPPRKLRSVMHWLTLGQRSPIPLYFGRIILAARRPRTGNRPPASWRKATWLMPRQEWEAHRASLHAALERDSKPQP